MGWTVGRGAGKVSIIVGALIIVFSSIYIALTHFNYLPNQQWVFPWMTNYAICSIGLVVGLVLVEYGIYHRIVVSSYAKRVEALEKEKTEKEEMLRQKEAELHYARQKLTAAERKVEGKKRQLRRVSGRLGDRTRRLKEIERLARIRKKR